MVGRCRLFQAILDCLRSQRLRIIVFSLRRVLANHRRLDGRLHFAQRLCMLRASFFHLNDVIAELALHDFDVADILREDCLVELRHHAALLRESKLAARVLAAGIVRVLLRQIGPVAAALKLLENTVGLALAAASALGIGTRGHRDEDVPRPRLLREPCTRTGGR